jgi:hypothetical protein
VGLRPAAPLGLTPGEQQVAKLVAAGYTNKEVSSAFQFDFCRIKELAASAHVTFPLPTHLRCFVLVNGH